MPRNNKNKKNNAKNSNARVQRELQRVLAMERSLMSMVRRVPKGTRRAVTKAASQQVAKVAPGLHPIAQKLFHSLTNPRETIGAYMPTADAQPSMKVTARLRTTIDLSAGDSAALFPVPALNNQDTSFMWVRKTGGDWYTDSVNSLQSGLGSYNQLTFTTLPFSRDQSADGIVGKCSSYTINVKYVGTHMYRAGMGIFYENPDRCMLDQGTQGQAISGSSNCNSWASEQVTNPYYARYTNFAQEPEHEYIFHPTLWKPNGAGNAAGLWIGPQGDSSTQQFPCYNYMESIYFGSSGGVVGAPNGHLTLENNSSNSISFLIEVTANYEFSGSHALQYSTPSPAGPVEAISSVLQAVRHAKRDHASNPHHSFQKLAGNFLKTGAAAAVKVAKEGVTQELQQHGTTNASIAAGIAGMLL